MVPLRLMVIGILLSSAYSRFLFAPSCNGTGDFIPSRITFEEPKSKKVYLITKDDNGVNLQVNQKLCSLPANQLIQAKDGNINSWTKGKINPICSYNQTLLSYDGNVLVSCKGKKGEARNELSELKLNLTSTSMDSTTSGDKEIVTTETPDYTYFSKGFLRVVPTKTSNSSDVFTYINKEISTTAIYKLGNAQKIQSTIKAPTNTILPVPKTSTKITITWDNDTILSTQQISSIYPPAGSTFSPEKVPNDFKTTRKFMDIFSTPKEIIEISYPQKASSKPSSLTVTPIVKPIFPSNSSSEFKMSTTFTSPVQSTLRPDISKEVLSTYIPLELTNSIQPHRSSTKNQISINIPNLEVSKDTDISPFTTTSTLTVTLLKTSSQLIDLTNGMVLVHPTIASLTSTDYPDSPITTKPIESMNPIKASTESLNTAFDFYPTKLSSPKTLPTLMLSSSVSPSPTSLPSSASLSQILLSSTKGHFLRYNEASTGTAKKSDLTLYIIIGGILVVIISMTVLISVIMIMKKQRKGHGEMIDLETVNALPVNEANSQTNILRVNERNSETKIQKTSVFSGRPNAFRTSVQSPKCLTLPMNSEPDYSLY